MLINLFCCLHKLEPNTACLQINYFWCQFHNLYQLVSPNCLMCQTLFTISILLLVIGGSVLHWFSGIIRCRRQETTCNFPQMMSPNESKSTAITYHQKTLAILINCSLQVVGTMIQYLSICALSNPESRT